MSDGQGGRPITIEEARERWAIKPEEAFPLLSLGRSAGYDALRRGEIPSLRVGRRLLVPVPALLRLLGAEENRSDPLALSVQRDPETVSEMALSAAPPVGASSGRTTPDQR